MKSKKILKTFIASSVLLLLLTGCYGALQNQIDEMRGETQRAEEAAVEAAEAADEAAEAAEGDDVTTESADASTKEETEPQDSES